MVYHGGKVMFFWVGVHSEHSIIIERMEILGRGKVCFLYSGNVYVVFGKEVV